MRGGPHTVVLVHASEADEIVSLAEHIEPNALQVQSDVPPHDLLRVKKQCPQISIIKAFSVRRGLDIDELEGEIRRYVVHGAIDAVLLDSERGGSGVVHNWETSREIVTRFAHLPVLLAGGLNKDNVAQARQRVGPYGVDVMTGVTSPGRRDRKDESRLREFFKAWNESLQVQTNEG
jgi:phosphoribosylanthranilate isomerase